MYRNSYQHGLLTIFSSSGSRPLLMWAAHVKNGHVRTITDPDIKSQVVDIVGVNVSTTYITCPKDPKQSLGIHLPYLVMVVKNLHKYFTFEVTILDETDCRRRFRVSNFQSSTTIHPFCTAMPIGLSGGWNQIQFNLAEFTRRAYKLQFAEVVRIQINANARLRRIYFAERLYAEEELPVDYKLFFPVRSSHKKPLKPPVIEEATTVKEIEEKTTSKESLRAVASLGVEKMQSQAKSVGRVSTIHQITSKRGSQVSQKSLIGATASEKGSVNIIDEESPGKPKSSESIGKSNAPSVKEVTEAGALSTTSQHDESGPAGVEQSLKSVQGSAKEIKDIAVELIKSTQSLAEEAVNISRKTSALGGSATNRSVKSVRLQDDVKEEPIEVKVEGQDPPDENETVKVEEINPETEITTATEGSLRAIKEESEPATNIE